jgi:VIT1/CCC1 family predicted Fe2+/Mn2+ transporter
MTLEEPVQRRIATAKKEFSIGAGLVITAIGTAFGLIFLLFTPAKYPTSIVAVSAVLSFFCLWYFPHTLAHYLVGKMVGIRFRHFFLGKSAIMRLHWPVNRVLKYFPVLGISIEKLNYREVLKKKKVMMLWSGPIVSMILPFLVPVTLFVLGHKTLTAIFVVIALANLLFTTYFSPKVGCISKAKKAATG